MISLDGQKSVKDAADQMAKHDISSVLVTASGKYVGIVTERDIVRKVTEGARDPASVALKDVMSSPLITIDANEGLGEATALMASKKIRQLLVVDVDGNILGIFTQRDLQEKILEVFRSLGEDVSLL
jgi:CBS domain-containing protein